MTTSRAILCVAAVLALAGCQQDLQNDPLLLATQVGADAATITTTQYTGRSLQLKIRNGGISTRVRGDTSALIGIATIWRQGHGLVLVIDVDAPVDISSADLCPYDAATYGGKDYDRVQKIDLDLRGIRFIADHIDEDRIRYYGIIGQASLSAIGEPFWVDINLWDRTAERRLLAMLTFLIDHHGKIRYHERP